MSSDFHETNLNLISIGARVKGDIHLEKTCRVFGTIEGNVSAAEGSILILGQTSVIEGDVHGDTVIVHGFVRGTVAAKTRICISGCGRVLGDLRSPSLEVDPGAMFEGRATISGPAPTVSETPA